MEPTRDDEPLPDDWPRGVKMPYLVDNVRDLPPDYRPPSWRELQDPHPDVDPEEVDRFMRLVEEEC